MRTSRSFSWSLLLNTTGKEIKKQCTFCNLRGLYGERWPFKEKECRSCVWFLSSSSSSLTAVTGNTENSFSFHLEQLLHVLVISEAVHGAWQTEYIFSAKEIVLFLKTVIQGQMLPCWAKPCWALCIHAWNFFFIIASACISTRGSGGSFLTLFCAFAESVFTSGVHKCYRWPACTRPNGDKPVWLQTFLTSVE